MENHKISKLLHDSTVSKFVTKNWIEVNDLLGSQYSFSNNIRFRTPMLRSDYYNYSEAYVILKERVIVEGTNTINRRNKKLTFKNVPSFRSYVYKIAQL